MKPFNVAICFIIFNRPDTTEIVFQQIRAIKPKKIYVISDAARNEAEKEIVQRTRAIVEDNVDWECEVIKNYAQINMGCGPRVSSGISWVFEREEELIILEDDCVPDQSFFYFAQEMLEKYKNDERIMYITGDNFHKDIVIHDSYDFVKIGWIWGWATWKRAWSKYDFQFSHWKRDRETVRRFYNKDEYEVFARDLDSLIEKGMYTWDYQWQYCCAINGGLCIVPKVNLVNNIGFRPDATHTKTANPYYDGTTKTIRFPLKDPEAILPNVEYDRKTLRYMKGFDPNIVKKILRRVRKLIRNRT